MDILWDSSVASLGIACQLGLEFSIVEFTISKYMMICFIYYPVDTRNKLKVQKALIWGPGQDMNFLFNVGCATIVGLTIKDLADQPWLTLT